MSAATEAAASPRRPAIRVRRRFRFSLSQRQFLAALTAVFILLFVLIVLQSGAATAGNEVWRGLVLGAIYALIAVGYTLVYGIIELINFAHGDVFTLSCFYSIFLAGIPGVQPGFFQRFFGFNLNALAASGPGGLVLALLIIFPITLTLAGLTGVVIERVAYRRLRDAPRLAPLITAVGVSFFLEGLMFAFFIPPAPPGHPGYATPGSAYPTGEDGWIPTTQVLFRIGGNNGVTIGANDTLVVVVAIVAMFVLAGFIRYSRTGKAMRASAQNRDAALLCGININRTISATFFIGSAMAAVGGIIYSMHYHTITWNQGYQLGLIAFTAAVLGGIGNIVGAGIGGFLIGLIEAFVVTLLPNGGSWALIVVFAVLILVLTLQPTGLLGMRVPDRA
jgi:branched-chain amino acid transport system permease protein